MAADDARLSRFAREHHLRFEVEPEEVEEAEGRELVGVRIRLFASRPGERLVAPTSPASAELLRELRSFAEGLVAPAEDAHRAEVAPEPPALYQSPAAPDVDEVTLTVRLHCTAPEHRRPGEGEGRCLGALRERLGALGVSHDG